MAKTDEKATLQLIINGQQAKSSLKDVTVTMIGLERQLRGMKKADDPAGFKLMTDQLAEVRKAHGQMINEIRGGEGSLNKFKLTWKDIAAGVVGGNIAGNALNLIKDQIVSLIPLNAKLSDSFADVSKDTGMTANEVGELNEELKELNTRTAVDELRKLASEGGKFGVVKDQVDEFAESTDRLNVAFGDQFDSVEELASTTLKLRNIFQDIKSENVGDDITHIGNAMNVLVDSGAATGKVMADLSGRIGGVAIPLGLTTAQVLGLSASLEELNVAPERGATAVTTILQKMLTDTKSFAKVAKMEVKDFEHLLNNDLFGAFMAFAKGAKEGGKSATEFAGIMADTELSGSGASEVLTKLANNQVMVTEKVNLASDAITNATSVTNEFNVKNNNNAAVWEKIGKVITGWKESAAAGLGPLVMLFGKWFGVIDEMAIKMGEFNDQQEKTLSAETKLPALIKRYEELQLNTNKSNEEQNEMNKIMQEMASVVPTAAYEFDQYGNVLGVDIEIIREFIKEQRRMLETMRGSRKEELAHEKLLLSRRVANIQQTLNRGTMRTVDDETGAVAERKLREDEIKSLQKDLAKIQEQKMAIVKSERELTGIAEKATGRSQRAPKDTSGAKPDVPGGGGSSLSKEEEKKALSERERLNDELLKNQQQLTLNMLGEHQKELQAAQNKYDELTKKAKGNAEQLAKIESQAKQEVDQINDKYNKKYLSDFDKTIRGQLGHLNSRKKEEFDYADSRANDAAKRADKEWFEIVDHYDREIALAKSRNESIVQLEKDKQAEIDKLFAGRAAKQTNDYLADLQDSYQSELALAEESGISKEAIVRDHLERLKVLREQYGLLDVEQQKKVNKDIVKSERELLAIKLDNINKTGSAMTAGSQAISDLLSLTADNQSEYAEFQKAIGLFQIAVETGTAVASAVAQGTKGDPYTVILRIATAVAAVTAGMLKAKALMNEAKQPATPAFREHGGYTDLGSIAQDNSGNPEGWVARPTLFNLGKRSYIAGEGYKKEYVLSSAMLRNPAVADFAASMEALRQQRFFENGGSTAMSSSPAQVSFDPRMNDMLKYLQIIASKQTGLNYNMFEQYRDLVDNTRARASA